MKLKKVLSLALCGVMLSTTAVSIVPTIFAKESGTEHIILHQDMVQRLKTVVLNNQQSIMIILS